MDKCVEKPPTNYKTYDHSSFFKFFQGITCQKFEEKMSVIYNWPKRITMQIILNRIKPNVLVETHKNVNLKLTLSLLCNFILGSQS